MIFWAITPTPLLVGLLVGLLIGLLVGLLIAGPFAVYFTIRTNTVVLKSKY